MEDSGGSSTPIEDWLGIDEWSRILGFLHWKELLASRGVSWKWHTAVQAAFDAPFRVPDREDAALCLRWLEKALPCTKRICLDFSSTIDDESEIASEEDAMPTLAEDFGSGSIGDYLYAELGLEPPLPSLPPSPPPIDIGVLAKFRYLKHLTLSGTSLRGHYPFLFEFQELITLDLSHNHELEWDLSDLKGLSKLRDLRAIDNHALAGNLKSLRVLKNTLVSLELGGCENITGNVLDLAVFPLLEDLSLNPTNITGDIRHLIGPRAFVAVRILDLPEGVYGFGEVIHRINDAPLLMRVLHHWQQRLSSPSSLFFHRRWRLADDAPERQILHPFHRTVYNPPFWLESVQAGPRVGWRWTNCLPGGSCEVQWLDEEPHPGEEGYEQYIEDMEQIRADTVLYEGFASAPSEDDYHRLLGLGVPP